MVRRSAFKILLLLFLLTSLSVAQTPIAIVGGTLIDGMIGAPVENSVVVIQGSKIVAVGTKENTRIPDGAQIIDAGDKYIIPGLIDCHVHYEQPRDLVQMLAWGVTSVNCMFESTDQALEMERRTASDTIHSPQIYATAPIFTCKGGWWEGEGFPIDSTINRFPATPEEAREAVRKVKAKGIKRIKLMYDDMGWCRDPLPRLIKVNIDIMKALLDEAENMGLFVEVHAPVFGDASEIVNAKVHDDNSLEHQASLALAHGIIDERIPESGLFGSRMRVFHFFYVPTFCVFEFLADTRKFMNDALSDKRFSSALPDDLLQKYRGEEYYERYAKRYPNIKFVKEHLDTLNRNVITISAIDQTPAPLGTDMWAFPGIAVHLELEYMVKAGMKPAQALRAATGQGGYFLYPGRYPANLGSIEPTIGTDVPHDGQAADLLILDANPLDDIRNTRSVRTIIKHGKIFDHQQLIEESKLMK